MRSLQPTVRFRLRSEHLDLVRAALGEGDVATAAYERWRAAVPLEQTDAGSYRLIPLVHHNLAATGALSDAERTRFGKMARFTWVKTRLITHRAASARSVLVDAGIDSLAIKGLAVTHHSGLDAGLRPMDDADVIVHAPAAARSLDALGAAGFTSDEFDLGATDGIGAMVAGHHGLNLRDGSGVQVDLHWHSIPHALHPAADAAMWRRSHDGFPGIEDTLVQVLAHATRWSWAPSVQWVADAVAIIRVGLDWEIISQEIRALRIGVPTADALAVVASTGLVDLPDRLLERLRRAPPVQRAEARVRRQPDGSWRPSTTAERLADGFGDHVRRTVAPGRRLGAAHLGSFLLERWDVERMRHLPAHALWILSGRRGVCRPRQGGTEGTGISGPPQNPTPAGTEVGQTLRFTSGGNGLGLLGRGWSFPENHGSWTIGTEATVIVPMPPASEHADQDLRLRFRVVPFLTTHEPTRRVDVYVDGVHSARWRFQGPTWSPQDRTLSLAAERVLGTTTEIRFVIHHPISPQALDHDVGTRQLGLSLGEVTITADP